MVRITGIEPVRLTAIEPNLSCLPISPYPHLCPICIIGQVYRQPPRYSYHPLVQLNFWYFSALPSAAPQIAGESLYTTGKFCAKLQQEGIEPYLLIHGFQADIPTKFYVIDKTAGKQMVLHLLLRRWGI